MQDVVRASGLSVGAIYTYDAGKDELFCRAARDRWNAASTSSAIASPRAGRAPTSSRSRSASSSTRSIPATRACRGEATYLVQAWAEAGGASTVRETLIRRREKIGAIGQILIREGIARGELPAWLDVEALALGYSALLDGLVLQRIEDGEFMAPRGGGAAGLCRPRAARRLRRGDRSPGRDPATAAAVQLRPGPARGHGARLLATDPRACPALSPGGGHSWGAGP